MTSKRTRKTDDGQHGMAEERAVEAITTGAEADPAKLLQELELRNAELRQVRDELETALGKYRAMIDAFDGYMYICSQDFRIEFMNDRFIQRTGRDATGEYCYKALHDQDTVCEWCVNERVFSGEHVHWEVKSPKDGRWYEVNNSPIRNPNGTISKQAMITDITERKEAEGERDRLEAQLRQAQKMESVGRLAGGVAHDFNNMLGVIIGHAEVALMKMDPTQPIFADLLEIRKAAERSADLTRQLLAFARKQTIAPKVLNLNDTVAGMLKMLKRLIGEDIRLAWQPAADLWPVRVDPSQIDQIMANLCVNARDSIAGAGRVTIETGNSVLDPGFCASHPGSVPGEYARITIRDDGCGMDKETLSRIFEPFFTTKEMGKGTGLGLATVYGTVKQNNGFIDASSKPGSGTAFSIYLPRHLEKSGQAGKEGAQEQAERGKETILLVEDEIAILNVIGTMLELQGYRVLAADTPGEAIRLAELHKGEIELLMTDVVMPEMNGRDLAEKLLTRYPRLKRLFMSGYTANIITLHGVLDNDMHFIQKPFTMQEMAAKVREVLDGKQQSSEE